MEPLLKASAQSGNSLPYLLVQPLLHIIELYWHMPVDLHIGSIIISANDNSNENSARNLSLDWLVSNLRWLWLFLTATFILVQNYLSPEILPNFNRLLILLLIGVVLNAIYAGFLWAKFFPEWLAATAIVVDAIWAVALLVMLIEQAQLLLPLAGCSARSLHPLFPKQISRSRRHRQ